jgi:hypothetical protein
VLFGAPLSRLFGACAVAAALVVVLALVLRRRALVEQLRAVRTELSAAMWLFAVVPWAWIASFVALLLRARAAAGAWPHGARFVPAAGIGELRRFPVAAETFGLHYELVAGSLVATPLALLASATLAMLASPVRTRREVSSAVATGIGGAAIVFAISVVDPGGSFGWLRD